MSEPLLQAKSVTAGYRPAAPILHGVSLEILPGEIVALLGPNGAGKSTLVKAIAGLVQVSSGTVRFLGQAQHPDGAWIPLWFGNQAARDEANPVYGTARVLEGLAALSDVETIPEAECRAARWLVEAQGGDGGWGGAPDVSPSIEETALAVSALATFGRLPRAATVRRIDEALTRGAGWLIAATDGGRRAETTPIGLYFAKLWYSEKLYPWTFALGALAAAILPSDEQ